MSYSKIESILDTVVPEDVSVYKVQASPSEERYVVWTPTGTRSERAEGAPICTVNLGVVTVATQTENDPLPAQIIAALIAGRVAVGQDEQSFDEQTIVLHTAQGVLIVRGEQLHLQMLSLEGGQICVDGTIDALIYEDDSREQGGFFSRLFR